MQIPRISSNCAFRASGITVTHDNGSHCGVSKDKNGVYHYHFASIPGYPGFEYKELTEQQAKDELLKLILSVKPTDKVEINH